MKNKGEKGFQSKKRSRKNKSVYNSWYFSAYVLTHNHLTYNVKVIHTHISHL